MGSKFAKNFLFLLSLFTQVYSQGIDNIWTMGYSSWAGRPYGGINIDFQSGFLDTSYVARPMNFLTSCANISDQDGNLLFYTNGIYLANRIDSPMVNGDNLNPSQYASSYAAYGQPLIQSHIIIPFPNDSMKYYLFHCTLDTANVHSALFGRFLYFTIIDMSLDGGLGAVISKNNILLDDSINQGGLSAVRHGNGRDWWLVFHQINSDQFVKFLITPYAITGPFRQNIGSHREGYSAQSTFSRDGSKYAIHDGEYDLDIMDFNRCTGNFSNCIHIPLNDSSIFGGVAFSPNGNVLYATSYAWVYQYDLTAANILASQTIVATWDSTFDPQPPYATYFWICKLAPDNKIYISTGNSTLHLHVINYPDSVGLACDLQQHAIPLPSFYSNSIPNHPNYHLQAWGGSICDTLGLPNVIEAGAAKISNSINPFPNPFSNKFYLQANIEFAEETRLFDSFGKEIIIANALIKNEYLEYSGSSLPTGIYFLVVNTNSSSHTFKLIKL